MNKFFAITFSLAFVLIAAGCTNIVDNPAANPLRIRLYWQNDPKTSVTIAWETLSVVSPEVQFGTSSSYGDTALADSVSNPATAEIRALHYAELTGLAPGTTYNYRCGGPGGWSENLTFTTAPAGETHFTFAAGGDSRNGMEALSALLALAAADDPAFFLFSGDAINKGLVNEWEEWFEATSGFSREIPIMPSTGNHEARKDPTLVNYFHYHFLPAATGTERYYSFDYGNAHFISLDSNDMDPEQVAWLDADLGATAKKWKIVMLHQCLFSSGPHFKEQKLRPVVCPIFDKHGVALVLTGHDHLYARSKPINWTISTNEAQDSYANAPCYIVSGSMGAPPYNPVSHNWWIATTFNKRHYCRVSVSAGSLVIEAVDSKGEVFDKATLTR